MTWKKTVLGALASSLVASFAAGIDACGPATLPPGIDSGAPPPQDARVIDTTDASATPCRSVGEQCVSNTECCTSICTSRVLVEAGGGEPTRCSASF